MKYIGINEVHLNMDRPRLMLQLFSMATFLITGSLNAQFYKNVNSEICFELYQGQDQLSQYRVYLVVDEETTFLADSSMLLRYSRNAINQRKAIADRWRREGRRVEIERAPFVTYPFQLNHLRRPELKKVE